MGRKCLGCLSLRTCSIFSAVVSLVFSVICLLLAFFRVRQMTEYSLESKLMFAAYGIYAIWILVTAPMSVGIFLERRFLFIPWLVFTPCFVVLFTVASIVIIGMHASTRMDMVGPVLIYGALSAQLILVVLAVFGVIVVVMYFRELEMEEKTGEAILRNGDKPNSKQYDAI